MVPFPSKMQGNIFPLSVDIYKFLTDDSRKRIKFKMAFASKQTFALDFGIPRALRHRERASTHQIMPVSSRQFECYTDSGLERILSRLHLCQMHFLSL